MRYFLISLFFLVVLLVSWLVIRIEQKLLVAFSYTYTFYFLTRSHALYFSRILTIVEERFVPV